MLVLMTKIEFKEEINKLKNMLQSNNDRIFLCSNIHPYLHGCIEAFLAEEIKYCKNSIYGVLDFDCKYNYRQNLGIDNCNSKRLLWLGFFEQEMLSCGKFKK